MNLAWPFLVGYLLDLGLGDPPSWPHPVRWLGRLITWWETRLYQPRISAGALFCLAVIGTSLAMGIGVVILAGKISPFAQFMVNCCLIYAGLATRSLHKETQGVEAALSRGHLAEARGHLARIVSREIAHLHEADIRRATLETLAENISDGVIGPLFYLLVAGVPGLILYKTANTMDSMVGYKNERYQHFGKAAARLDDVLNFLPARLAGGLICVAAGLAGLNRLEAWRIMKRDGACSLSPNAGRPMAALAGALGIQLGGPSRYFGGLVHKPHVGDPGPPASARHYRQAVTLLYGASALMAGLTFAALLLTGASFVGLLGLFR
ncbi:MAG: adenosylcobinamide-phosphate synthase CbiB [Desulfobaccales bacterium]